MELLCTELLEAKLNTAIRLFACEAAGNETSGFLTTQSVGIKIHT